MLEKFAFKEKLSSAKLNLMVDAINGSTKTHKGEFNAGLITEEGWYDSITLGRPEGSESDEKYVLYHSSNGGQVCFSRRNSGKAFARLGKEHPWVSLNHDDYATQQSAAAALIHYGTVSDEIAFNEWVANVSAGFGTDSNTRLAEVYAGNGCENKVIDVYKTVFLRPNDIIKVRTIYRRGFSWEGVDNYPYDSDAYIYVSDQTAAGHDLTHLKSDIVKVKSLGSLGFPFTEEQKQWQDLAFIRDILFRSDTEYGWHYIKVNVPVAGNYYLHIAGNFSSNASWIVFGDGQVLTGGGITENDLDENVRNLLHSTYFADINVQNIVNGEITGDLKTAFVNLRNAAEQARAKLIALKGGETYVIATIISYGSTFEMTFFYNGKHYYITADASDTTWTASITEYYVKPSGGISRTDLSQTVKTSLNKADSALQSSDLILNAEAGTISFGGKTFQLTEAQS